MTAENIERVNVAEVSRILESIDVCDGAVVGHTLKHDDDLDDVRTVTHLEPSRADTIKLQVAYNICDDNSEAPPRSLILIHKYVYVGGDLLCWVYSFANRRIYSYFNGDHTGTTRMLEDLTEDNI